MEKTDIQWWQKTVQNPWLMKHAAGQAVAPFVGKIVSLFNEDAAAQLAGNVQWLVSAVSAVVLVETQHRVFKTLHDRIGKVRSSIVSVLVPSVLTTSASFVAHHEAGTNAYASAAVVGVLSIVGYSSLQAFQLLNSNKNDQAET